MGMLTIEINILTRTHMRIRQIKLLVSIIVFCSFAVICVFLAVKLNPAAVTVFFLLLLVPSAAAYYYIIDKKSPRFEAQKDSICQGCKKQFKKAVLADMSQTDEEVVNHAVAAEISDDEVNTAAQSGEVIAFTTDEDNFHKMMDMFVNDLPNHLKEMQEALQEGNLQDLAFKVHALKSLDGFAGFGVYTEKARALEQAVADNQIEKVQQQLDDMIRLCLKAKPAHL